MNTLRKEYLTYFDPEKNSNKFYSAELQQEDNNYTIIYNWGRIGSKICENKKVFSNEDYAIKELAKQIASKIKKGYTKKDIVADKKTVNIQKMNVDNSNLDKNVAKFVKNIYELTNKKLVNYLGIDNNDIQTPIGNLGENGIKKGRDLLQLIVNAINNNDILSIKEYSKEYFKTIPRKMSHKITNEDWILNSDEKINKEMEVLDLYEDALNILNKKYSSIDEQYKNMNCEIKNVTEKQMEYVKDKIAKSHANNHNYKLKVLNAFKVNQKNSPEFDDTIGHNTNLFHGTRAENILGILSSNLKLPNTLNGVVKTGAMFGPGLYFANNCTKSANYSFGYWSNSNFNKAYLLICKVALGNVYEVEKAENFNKAPNGYNSVKGKKGPYLRNNEFIVYNENQVKIEYIVEIEKQK